MLDVTDEVACRAAVAEVIAKAGKISILVNNAGAGESSSWSYCLNEIRMQTLRARIQVALELL